MDTTNEQRENDLNRVANYIKKLKFKKAVVGGIEQEGAYQAMRELVSIFTEIYTAETERSDQLEVQLQQAREEQATAEKRILLLKEQTSQKAEKLRGEIDDQYRKLEEENNALKKRLQNQTVGSSSELEDLKKENDDLKKQLQSRTVSSSNEAEDLRKENKDLHTQIEKLASEKNNLAFELQKLQDHMKENKFQHETLEEIYLDANYRRKQIIDTANADAERMKQETEASNAKAKQSFEEEIQAERDAFDADLNNQRTAFYADMDARRTAFDMKQKQLEEEQQEASEKFNRDLAQSREQLIAQERATHERCDALLKEAEGKAFVLITNAETEGKEIISRANAEAEQRKVEMDQLVASAQEKYKAERTRYDNMLRRLGEMRAEVLRGIQRDINEMQSVAFQLSSSEIDAETETIVGIDALNDLQKSAE